MTGGTAYLVKSEKTNYGSNSWTTDLYIYVKVISQNVIANTSTIALGMYVYSKYSIAWSDFGTNGTSYIGTATSGSNCFTFTNGQSGSGTKWLIEDKQVTVYHNSNGTLTLPIYWHWGVNSPWGQYTGPSGSYNVTLSTIDRAAPTVSFSVSSITANGFKISASSTSTADIWQYSTNGGSTWTTFSTTASTSASVTLSSLSPNTNYTVKVRARRQYNQVYGTSGSSTVKTLGGAVVNSVSTVTADNARVTITPQCHRVRTVLHQFSGDQKREHDHPDRYWACMDEGYGKPLGHPVISTENHAAQLDGLDEVLHGHLCRFLLQRLNADRQHLKQDCYGADHGGKFWPSVGWLHLRRQLHDHKKPHRQRPAIRSELLDPQGHARNGNCKERCQYFQLHSFLQWAVIL